MSSDSKPVVPLITSTIPELIAYLKSSFRDRDFALVEKILTNREKFLKELVENTQALADLDKLTYEEKLKEAEEKSRVYMEKFRSLEVRMLTVEEDIARRSRIGVDDVSGIGKKIMEEFEKDDVVELDCQASGGDSTGYGEGSGNMDFVSTNTNLANCPDAQTLHSMPLVHGSSQVNSNVSNKDKKRCRSEEADPLPVNLACDNRAPILDLSACEAGDWIKSNLKTISGRAGSSTVVHISNDENAVACASNSYGVGRNLVFPDQLREEDIKDTSTSLSKRKRSLSENDNDEGSSLGKPKARSIQELDPVIHVKSPNTVFIRCCDDKDGDTLKGIDDESSSDSDNDPCSDKNMEMLLKSFRECKKWSSVEGLRSSFEQDPELCMSAVCALYRQQISRSISSEGLSFIKSHSDKISIAALGEYLVDGDPENKLRKTVSEVRPKDHAECKRLATEYCQQLHRIYLSEEDHLFHPGAIFSKF